MAENLLCSFRPSITINDIGVIPCESGAVELAKNLPVEVITNVLRFLGVSDRKEAALVNNAWYEASLDPILLQDTVVIFPAHAISEGIISSLGRRRTPNLILEHMDSTLHTEMIVKQACNGLTKNLISLSLKGSDVTETIFVDLLSNCYSLERLDISCCNSLFMSGMLLSRQNHIDALKKSLRNLKELNISSIRHISDATFNRLICTCPMIEKVILAGNQIIFHTDGYFSTSQKDNSAVFTFNNFLKFVKEQSDRIISLSLNRTAMNDAALNALACTQGLSLEEISLVNCRELSANGIINLCENQPLLKVLDISQCMETNDHVLSVLCSKLLHLKTLNVSKCNRLSDGSVATLHKLSALQSLDLSSCYNISSRGLSFSFQKRDFSTLTYLNLNCCSLINDAFFLGCFNHIRNLTYLNIGSTKITDRGLIIISSFLTKLRFLSLAWCSFITDDGLLGNLEGELPKHDEEGVCRCGRAHEPSKIFHAPLKYRPTPEWAENLHRDVHRVLDGRGEPLSNLHDLVELDLSKCSKITDMGLCKILPGLTSLESLHLTMCPDLSDKTLYVMARCNHSLRYIDISHCSNFTDRGIAMLSKNLSRLSSLNISNCDNLTDESIETLQRYVKKLKHLDVSLNGKISVSSTNQLENSLKHLQSVNKRLIGTELSSVFD